MKYLLILAMIFSQNVFANDLDKVLAKFNQKFSPTVVGAVGYDFTYRSEDNMTWININAVQRICKIEDVSVISSGHVYTAKENVCLNQWIMGIDNTIMQIKCRKLGKSNRIRTLAKDVTLEVVKEIIDRKITDINVK